MPETIEINIGTLTFDCRVSGNQDGELILFLHGFPETSHMWKRLMGDLSKLGYYCVAPNLRGFSKGACPKGKKNYFLPELANDVMGIAKSLDRSTFHLVGHDWGAAVGWKVVHDHPDTILSWTAISVPHAQAFGQAIVNDAEQRKMSQYIRNFQWPFLPETSIRKNDFGLFRKLWKNSEPEEVEDYLSVFRNKKQLTAALNYYRSNYRLLKKAATAQILGDIQVPSLFIWGSKDFAIGRTSVNDSHQFMKAEYTFVELESGHWLIQTKYDEVKTAITEHVTKYKSNIY